MFDSKAAKTALLKSIVSSFYQTQKLRIQIGNRLCAHFYTKLGVEKGAKLADQSGKKIEMIDYLKKEFRRISDALSTTAIVKSKDFNKVDASYKGIFSDFVEISFMQHYRSTLKTEQDILASLQEKLEEFPIWTEFLKDVHGMGPTIGGVLIAKIDPYKMETPASLWRYAGLDVALEDRNGEEDGRGRGRFKEHMMTVDYINSAGEEATRDSITFQPMLKTKLLGVMALNFVRCGNPKYTNEYYNYKNRIVQREAGAVEESKIAVDYYELLSKAGETLEASLAKAKTATEKTAAHRAHKEEVARLSELVYVPRTPAHINRMAIRYMVKWFLVDYYKAARTLEGLPITEEYSIRKLKMTHHESSRLHMVPSAEILEQFKKDGYEIDEEETPEDF